MATFKPSQNSVAGSTEAGTTTSDTHSFTGSMSITGSLTLNGSSITGGGGTPGGSDTQVQFNDGGSFGGDADMVWNKTTNVLTVNGTVTGSYLDVTTAATITQLGSNIMYNNVYGGNTQAISGSNQIPMDIHNIFDFQLDDATELTASAPVHGGSYMVYLRQDGTGNRTCGFDASTFKFPGGVAPTLSTGAGEVDVLTGIGMPSSAGGGTIVIFADVTKNFG